MRLKLAELAAAAGVKSELSTEVSGYSIDSRSLAVGELFFALPGEQQDGHSFVPQVLQMGAAAAMVDRDTADPERVIRVPNVLEGLQAAAGWARRKWAGKVVGVTGSAGKTTTKDIIASLLEVSFPVGRTMGNFNNHIGLPLSLFRIPDEAKIAVLEFGMNHLGEIRSLAKIAKPDVAVITNVGYAHVENFEEGIAGIAQAKQELVEGLPSDGLAILNEDDERVRNFARVHHGSTITFGLSEDADVRATNVELLESGVRFQVGSTSFESALVGRHAILNILAGITVANSFGIPNSSLVEPIRSLKPGKMRGERLNYKGVQIFNDSYNSNPDAVRNMLDVLRDTPARRHIAVLGEMLELGRWSEALHREVGSYAARCGVTVLVGIRGVARSMVQSAIEQGLGEDAAYFFSDSEQAGAWLRKMAQPGDAILFKGSRGTRVEKALEAFLQSDPN